MGRELTMSKGRKKEKSNGENPASKDKTNTESDPSKVPETKDEKETQSTGDSGPDVKKDESTSSDEEKPSDTQKDEKSEDESSEEKAAAQEAKKEKPELAKDDIIKILKTFTGVGQVMADRIYKAGFDSREKLESLTIDDLKKIPGVGQALAETIYEGMANAIKQFDEPPKKETEKVEPGITTKAMGFIKGTISKIGGFFKGKMPKSKKEPGKKVEVPTGTEGEVKEKLDSDKELSVVSETKSEIEKAEEKRDEEVVKDEYFPEVGAPTEAPEGELKYEQVTVEAGGAGSTTDLSAVAPTDTALTTGADTESKLKSESKHEAMRIQTDLQKIPKINLKDSSSLLKWFESKPNLRTEAGKLLFKAGYNNLEELSEAVVEDLVLVQGISQDEANTIFAELQKLN